MTLELSLHEKPEKLAALTLKKYYVYTHTHLTCQFITCPSIFDSCPDNLFGRREYVHTIRGRPPPEF